MRGRGPDAAVLDAWTLPDGPQHLGERVAVNATPSSRATTASKDSRCLHGVMR